MTEDGSPPGWIHLALAVTMALAAVGTAWAGFQSTKWSGVQANAYAQAGAARTDSDYAATLAGQDRIMDVVAFTSWLTVLHEDILAGRETMRWHDYQPRAGTISGEMFTRFRDELRPAVDAWLATRPLDNPNAPDTPFDMPEYQLAADATAQQLGDRADRLAERARTANQRADDYVLTAVVFALVLFFAGVASRAWGALALRLLFGLAVAALLAASAILLMLPVTI